MLVDKSNECKSAHRHNSSNIAFLYHVAHIAFESGSICMLRMPLLELILEFNYDKLKLLAQFCQESLRNEDFPNLHVSPSNGGRCACSDPSAMLARRRKIKMDEASIAPVDAQVNVKEREKEMMSSMLVN